MTAYGDLLRAAREARGASLRAVAARVGVAPAHLGDVERGRRGPLGPERDEALREAIGVGAERLEVLRCLARGAVGVEGLDEDAVARVVGAVAGERRRAG